MTQKHTQGEWKVEDLSHRQRGDDLSVFTLTPKHKNPRYIARVYGEGVLARDEGIDVERNANARLIAAAPDLLAALKEMRDASAVLLQAIHKAGVINEVLDLIDKKADGFGARADNAIARAEGKE